MSPEFGMDILADIDRSAERKKAVVRFDIEYIERNEDRLREVLLPDGPENGQDPDLALYEKVKSIFEGMESELTRVVGVHLSRGTINDPRFVSDPQVQLGFREYVFQAGLYRDEKISPRKAYTHVPRVTELGRQVIDARRAAAGFSTSARQKEVNSLFWDELWDRNPI